MPLSPKRKFFLFKQSKHFCAVPWNYFEVMTTGAIKTCSKGMPVGNITEDDLDSVLHSPKLMEIKTAMLEDRLHPNCVDCSNLTTGSEHFDLRNHYNPMFQEYNIDYDDLDAFDLHGVDLHWDNTCNFKCVYCGPMHSSLIAQEQQIQFPKMKPKFVDQLIERIVKNQYQMKEIYLSGGEPLLIKHNARLLSSIDNKDLPLRINSNLSLVQNGHAVFEEIKKFKNVLWTISAECMADKFNYTRAGGDWIEFLKNLETIKTLGHGLRINSVYFIGNVVDMFDTIEYFVRTHGITDITINQLGNHSYLQCRNASEELKTQARQRLQDFLDSGIIESKTNAYYNIARCVRELDHAQEDATGYIDYFDNLDQLRNTNWRDIFPELV